MSGASCTAQRIVVWGGSLQGQARLIVLDYLGKTVAEHEPYLRDSTRGSPLVEFRHIAIGADETVATIPFETYAIEEFDLSRGRHRVLLRELDWFPRRQRGAMRQPPWVARPEPMILDFQRDREGRLWTLVRAAHPDWKEAKDQFSMQKPPSLGAKEVFFQTIVEIIDPQTARVLGSIRLPGWVKGFLDHNTVYGVTERTDGTLSTAAWTLRLTTAR